MLSHAFVGTNDLIAAVNFYDRVLEPLKIKRKFIDREREWAGWKHVDADRPLFLVGIPFNGNNSTAGNGNMVAFSTSARSEVDRCYTLALAVGGLDEGAPGLRLEYHDNYYGAYFCDLDGNKICFYEMS